MLPIHLIHLAVQEVSVTVSGCVVRHVTCEHCGEKYIYQLRETAKGTATAFRFASKAKVKMKAEAAAKAKLGKKLAVGSAPPACPACGHYQHDMIALFRNRWWRVLGWSSFFTAMALAAFWIAASLEGVNPLVGVAERMAVGAMALALSASGWIAFKDFDRHPHRRTREALGDACSAMPKKEWDELLAGGEAAAVHREGW